MKRKGTILLLCACFLCFLQENCFSDYVEGIDTTNLSGYSSDSAFLVNGNGVLTAQHGIAYSSNGSGSGFFYCSFDDIKMAYQGNYGNILYGGSPTSECFVVWKKDSTYCKVQILSKLASGQYTYKWGMNAIPNDRMLERADYDRSIRYKPNNVHFHYRYLAGDTLFWDPPLANNNHLLGYTIYRTKIGAIIDTAAQIDLAQWDSVGFVDSSKKSGVVDPIDQFYQNLVATYAEGNSDFLQGWTHFVPAVATKDAWLLPEELKNKISIRKTTNGYSINFEPLPGRFNPLSLAVYGLSGKQLSRFENIRSNRVFFNTSDRNFASGLCVVKAEFSDKTVLNQKFMFSK